MAKKCPAKERIHQKAKYIKTKPYYLVKIPWVATSGSDACPCQYNNALHAAFHSLLAAMTIDGMEDVRYWMMQSRRKLTAAIRASAKAGAMVPIVGAEYPDPEDREVAHV